MICEKIEFKFGLPIKVSLNSLSKKMKFNRSFKLIWVLNGKISFKSRNFKKDCVDIFKLKSGEMQIINSYTPYKLLEISPESQYLVLDFKCNFISENENYDETKVFYLNNKNKQESLNEIKYLTASLILDYFKVDHQLLEKIEVNLNTLIERLNNNYCIHTQRDGDFYNKQKVNIVNKVIKKLENDYQEKLTLKKIAADFHYNSSYLSEKFKSLTGVNFKSYLDRIKLEKILTELLYTNKNINEIALEAGFRNIKSFYRVFNE